jgi:hypothetical protein
MPTSAELLFSIAGAIVAPGWALLVFRPSWRWSTGVIPGIIVPVILGTLYTGLILTNFFGAEGGFGSLADVARLFENRYLLLAGWVHYLTFDLFIGAWEVRDARRLRINHLLVVPCLLLTFLLGPVGLLLYLGLRASLRGTYSIETA